MDGVIVWDELVTHVENKEMYKLRRSAEQLKAYHEYMLEMKKKFKSVADMIMIEKFGYTQRTGSDDLLEAIRPTEKGSRFIWKPNDFPYNFEPGISHDLIWCESGKILEEEIDSVIKMHKDDSHETVHFINPTALQTIPECLHVHVLSRKKRSD
eukprot:m.47702 g.47702  ORF g.47702 m.47702 type:complete len:154 (-) comp20557_c1_seq1:53-514(-)